MRRLAYPLLGVWAALAVVAVVMQAQAGEQLEGLTTLALGVLAGVGALLSRRRPENPIGPILLGLALVVTLSVVGDGISSRYEDNADPGLGVRLVVWFNEAVIYVWFGLVGLLLPLLFPDGRLPVAPLATGPVGRRWRLVALAVLGTRSASSRSTGTATGISQPAGHRRPRG